MEQARQGRLLRCVSTRLTVGLACVMRRQTVLSHVSSIFRCLLVLDYSTGRDCSLECAISAGSRGGAFETFRKFQNQRRRRQPGLHVVMFVACCDASGAGMYGAGPNSYKFCDSDRFGLARLHSALGQELGDS